MNFPFDLVDLRLFVHIVDAGSITSGAKASCLSLASASSRVLKMEKSLNTSLLQRAQRGVRPTAAGEVLAAHARGIVEETASMRSDLEDHALGRKSCLAMMGTSVAVREYLPDLLGRFLVAYPNVNLTLAEAVSEEITSAVGLGHVDLGLVTSRFPVDGVEYMPFRHNPYALLVPREHVLAAKLSVSPVSPVSIAVATPFDVVGLPEDSALQQTWESWLAARGERLNCRIRVPSFDAMARLIAGGVGVGLMPQPLAVRYANALPTVAIPLSDEELMRPLLLCARGFSQLPPHGRSLVKLLREAGASAAL